MLQLVEAYAFAEAAAILKARLREISETQQTQVEQVFLDWRDLPPDSRPDFLTYAHHRRRPELAAHQTGDRHDPPRPARPRSSSRSPSL